MSTEKYVNYIAEQVHKERVMGFRPLHEAAGALASKTKGAHSVDKIHSEDGHQVHAAAHDEHTEYHHIDDKGKHRGAIGIGNDESVPSLKTIKKHLPHAPDHVHKAIHKDMKENSFDDD